MRHYMGTLETEMLDMAAGQGSGVYQITVSQPGDPDYIDFNAIFEKDRQAGIAKMELGLKNLKTVTLPLAFQEIQADLAAGDYELALLQDFSLNMLYAEREEYIAKAKALAEDRKKQIRGDFPYTRILGLPLTTWGIIGAGALVAFVVVVKTIRR